MVSAARFKGLSGVMDTIPRYLNGMTSATEQKHVHQNNGNSRDKKNSGNRNPGSSNNFQRGSSQAPSGQRNDNFSRGSSRPQSQQPNNFQHESTAPRLSDKEKADLLASGSCFRCKKPGHLSRNNYNIEIEPESLESDEAEAIDSLELGAITWQSSRLGTPWL